MSVRCVLSFNNRYTHARSPPTKHFLPYFPVRRLRSASRELRANYNSSISFRSIYYEVRTSDYCIILSLVKRHNRLPGKSPSRRGGTRSSLREPFRSVSLYVSSDFTPVCRSQFYPKGPSKKHELSRSRACRGVGELGVQPRVWGNAQDIFWYRMLYMDPIPKDVDGLAKKCYEEAIE